MTLKRPTVPMPKGHGGLGGTRLADEPVFARSTLKTSRYPRLEVQISAVTGVKGPSLLSRHKSPVACSICHRFISKQAISPGDYCPRCGSSGKADEDTRYYSGMYDGPHYKHLVTE